MNPSFPLEVNVSFAAAAGGGIDTSIAPHLALRVEGDYLHSSMTAGGLEQNQLHDLVASNGRVSTGLAFRF